MAVTITHTQVRSVQVGPAYRTVDTVTASVNIPPEAFVFLVADDSFQHVATVDNILNLPNTKAQAIIDGKDAYRLAVVQKDYAILSDAEEFANTLIQRMKLLVIEYDAAVNDFVGTTTETLSS
jgi:hypothetical protein